ncbi:MAG: N-acetylmuramoyl-L-alanine amidase [Candidatus Improbicoccus devescovinae]|nr:MAG: N-acetylmuramoyl-L-alanine amidase [Candidatus Improbicoccus devescovinae]
MKILTTNKRAFLNLTLICFFIISIVTLGAVGITKIMTLNNTTKIVDKKIPLIIIDAGHGGEDGGAVTTHDGGEPIIEKNINLAITLKLRDLLRISGCQVILTREKDKAIYDPESKSLRQKKRSDLRNRLELINQYSDSNTCFVSIHQNKFPDEKYFGTQIFFSTNNPNSEVFAEHVRNNIISKIQPENKREIKPATSKIFLLNNSKIPAITVECGFLSNKQEAQKLITNDYQMKVAASIFGGIVDYWTKNNQNN